MKELIYRRLYFLHKEELRKYPERKHKIEREILTNPYVACQYAIEVMNGRWPEAEEIIRTDSDEWSRYRLHILKTKKKRLLDEKNGII